MSAEMFGIVVDYLYTSYGPFALLCSALLRALLTHSQRRAQISAENAIEVLVAADLLNLARLVQMAEIALQRVGHLHSAFRISRKLKLVIRR